MVLSITSFMCIYIQLAFNDLNVIIVIAVSYRVRWQRVIYLKNKAHDCGL